MTLSASCHCGATTIQLPYLPTEASTCNCTFCSRTGAVWAYFKPGELAITSDNHDTFYSATGNGNEHHFCAHCGIHTWGVSPDWGSLYNADGTPKNGDATAIPTSQIYALNLRLIDDLDWSKIKIEQMDGRNNW